MFAREGYALITGSIILCGISWAFAFLIGGYWGMLPGIFGIFVLAFTLYFFRDPPRTPPTGHDNVLLSPADGKVIEIEDHNDSIFLDARAKRVSIFLSPLDVHVNRIPADGVIELVNYVPGKYLVAWHPKASELNERSEIGLVHPSGAKVLFKQIAGAVARRVVFHVSKGDRVRAGDRFGIVKFGSRMDVIVPDTATFEVVVGDKVKGGETILGYL